MTGRMKDAVRFGIIGVVTFAVVFWVELSWLEIVARLMGRERLTFGEQPSWSLTLRSAVGAVPWVMGAGICVFAVVRRRWVPPVAFAASQVLCIAAFLAVISFRRL